MDGVEGPGRVLSGSGRMLIVDRVRNVVEGSGWVFLKKGLEGY